MNKIFVVAKNEYLIAVTSKAFLIGVIMMPIFMGGALVVQYLTKDQVDLSDRKIAIVDETGRLFESIQTASEAYNDSQIFDYGSEEDSQGSEGEEAGPSEPVQVKPKFLVEQFTPDQDDTDYGLALAKRVKDGDLFAYAIVRQGILGLGQDGEVSYHSQTPSYQTLSNWLRGVVNGEVKRIHIQEMELSQENVAALTSQVPVKQYGLDEEKEGGGIKKAEEENRILTFIVPFAGLMLMFMMVMSTAPAMLNNVLEEKMQKISEFLVSSITPFQLMAGKLLGSVAVGLTLSAIYLSATYALAHHYEFADKLPPSIYLWFVFYLFIALVIFGSIFSAIGAACSEIRDAQSLMTPVMLLVIIPMMCMGPILNSPSSSFAKAVSLFPPATPMIMFARIAIPPGPEAWEIILGTVFAVLFAIMSVWAAGKVFRIGILSQGQAPTFAKLISWVLTK